MIYLDNAGTTKMFEQCIDVHKHFSCQQFYNPSALSAISAKLSVCITDVEKFILQNLGANEGNVLFTSCATESNNLAVNGSLRNGDWEYVFSLGEHPSVFNVAKKLQLEGRKARFVPLCKDGTVDLQALEEVLNEKTRFISIIHVSNETGAINDISKISEIKNRKCPKAILHMDGVQAFKKIPLSLRSSAVDLYSFSGHKIHAPKGIAGLYVKNKNALKQLFEGGGQQYGLRSGTENVSGIMQLSKAVEMIDEKANLQKVQNLCDVFNKNISSDIKILQFGLTQNMHSPYIENLIFEGVKGETMLHALEKAGVIVGLGSACSAKKAGNRVLQELGQDANQIISSVRISFNAYLTEDEIVKAANIINQTYQMIKTKVQ